MNDHINSLSDESVSIHDATLRSLQLLHIALDRSRGMEADTIDAERFKTIVLEADSMLFFARKLWSDERSLQFFHKRCMTFRTKALLRLGSLTNDDRAADPLAAGAALGKEINRYRDRFGFELTRLKGCVSEEKAPVAEYICPDLLQLAYEIRVNLDGVVAGERQVVSPHLCLLTRRMAAGRRCMNGQSAPLLETLAAMLEADWRVSRGPAVDQKTSRRVALWWKINRPDYERLMS